MMSVQRLERNVQGIFGLDEIKEHIRVDYDDEDAGITRMAGSATIEAEDYASMGFLNQAIRVTLDAWPRCHTFRLPIGPLLDWDSVTVTADGQPFDDFSVLTGQRPALRLSDTRPAGVIVIEYVAGFGEAGTDIPDDLRQALLDQVAVYYDARGAVDRKTAALSPHFARIVGRYRGVRA